MKSLKIRVKSGDKESVLVGSLDVASNYQMLGFNSDAIEYLEEALGLATDLNNSRLTLDCYHLLGQNYEQLGNEEEAKAWYAKAEKLQAYLEVQSSKDENIAEVTKPQKEVKKAEAEKRLELELSSLQQEIAQQEKDSLNKTLQAKQDSLFKVAQKEKLNQNLDSKLIKEQKAKQGLMILSVVFGFTLLIGVVIALILSNRRQKRAKVELEKQNKELAEKNEQMIKDMLK